MAAMNSVDFVVTGVSHATRYAPALDRGHASLSLERTVKIIVRRPSTAKPATGWTQRWKVRAFPSSAVGQTVSGMSRTTGSPSFSPPTFKGFKLAHAAVRPFRSSFSVSLAPFPRQWISSELLPALRQGIIDGQENPPAVVYPYQIYEAQKILLADRARERAHAAAGQ